MHVTSHTFKSQSGYTLIEVSISAAVSLIIGLSVLKSFNNVKHQEKRIERKHLAAQELMLFKKQFKRHFESKYRRGLADTVPGILEITQPGVFAADSECRGVQIARRLDSGVVQTIRYETVCVPRSDGFETGQYASGAICPVGQVPRVRVSSSNGDVQWFPSSAQGGREMVLCFRRVDNTDDYNVDLTVGYLKELTIAGITNDGNQSIHRSFLTDFLNLSAKDIAPGIDLRP